MSEGTLSETGRVQTRFGLTNAALAARWYGGDLLSRTKVDMLRRHLNVVGKTDLGESFTTILRETYAGDRDGREFVWETLAA